MALSFLSFSSAIKESTTLIKAAMRERTKKVANLLGQLGKNTSNGAAKC